MSRIGRPPLDELLSEETGMKCGYVGNEGEPYEYEDHPLRNVLALCDAIITNSNVDINNIRTGSGMDDPPAPHIPATYYEGRRNAAQSVKGYILKQLSP